MNIPKPKILVFLILTSTLEPCFAHEESMENEQLGNERLQTTEQSLTEDINILAREIGVDRDVIRSSIQFQDEFTDFFEELSRQYPNQISRVWLDPAPSAQAYVEFIGDAPKIQTALNVDITGGGIYSFQEQEQRAEHLAQVLVANNLTNLMTYYNHETGLIKLVIKVADQQEAISDTVLERIISNQKGLDEDEQLLFDHLSLAEIDYVITEGGGDIIELQHSRGGNWLRDDGERECTSGWSVSGPKGDGIITTGHCKGLNQFEESPSIIYNMTFKDQNYGLGGDVEYHTTVHKEPAEYWASSSSLRSVEGIKKNQNMLKGLTVCRYGRSSNFRTCNHKIKAKSVWIVTSSGTLLTKMVKVTGVSAISGDSGGPWSFGTTAWGVHSAIGNKNSYFTPVQQAEKKLGITIKTK